jgi:tetratricopeptide (TPR) repeat protein
LAKKKSKNKRRSGGKQAGGNSLARYQNAAAKNNWQEAMRVAKELVKQEGPDHMPLLVEAYLGRAQALEAKGLLQEALTILQNAADKCQDARVEKACVRLWFQMGQWTKLAEHYTRCHKQGEKAKTALIDPWLAASLLGGVPELEDRLPETCPPRLHLAAARDAMNAFCEGRDQDLSQALKRIPFRSPYRDFSLILKGFSASATDDTRLNACLERIGPRSAFRHLAQTLIKRQRAMESDLTEMKPAELSLVVSQFGLSDQAVATCQKIFQLPPKKAAAFLLKHDPAESGLPLSLLRAYLEDHLPHNPSLFTRFRKRFEVPHYEEHRIRALALKLKDGFCDDIHADWRDYLAALEDDPQLEDKEIRFGLILLWLGDLYAKEEVNGGIVFEDWLCILLWEESLEHDPKNPILYMGMLYALSQELEDEPEAKKKHQRLLEQAVKQLPGEPMILDAAIDAALDRKAYKKAAGYAKQLLAKDSVNIGVRRRLVTALLGHAGKLFGGKKWSAAAREVAEAAEFARYGADKERVAVYKARIELGMQRLDSAHQMLTEGWQACPNIASKLLFIQSCREVGFPEKSLDKQVKQWYVELHKLEPNQAHLLQILNYLKIQQNENLKAFIAPFSKFFKACAMSEIDEKILIRACKTLMDLDLYEQAAGLAREARRHYAKADFTYYVMAAKMYGKEQTLSERDIAQLKRALDQARDDGDQPMAELIEKLFFHIEFFEAMENRIGMDFGDDLDDDQLDELLGNPFLQDLVDMMGDMDVD